MRQAEWASAHARKLLPTPAVPVIRTAFTDPPEIAHLHERSHRQTPHSSQVEIFNDRPLRQACPTQSLREPGSGALGRLVLDQ